MCRRESSGYGWWEGEAVLEVLVVRLPLHAARVSVWERAGETLAHGVVGRRDDVAAPARRVRGRLLLAEEDVVGAAGGRCWCSRDGGVCCQAAPEDPCLIYMYIRTNAYEKTRDEAKIGSGQIRGEGGGHGKAMGNEEEEPDSSSLSQSWASATQRDAETGAAVDGDEDRREREGQASNQATKQAINQSIKQEAYQVGFWCSDESMGPWWFLFLMAACLYVVCTVQSGVYEVRTRRVGRTKQRREEEEVLGNPIPGDVSDQGRAEEEARRRRRAARDGKLDSSRLEKSSYSTLGTRCSERFEVFPAVWFLKLGKWDFPTLRMRPDAQRVGLELEGGGDQRVGQRWSFRCFCSLSSFFGEVGRGISLSFSPTVDLRVEEGRKRRSRKTSNSQAAARRMDDDVPVAIYLAPAQRVDERHGYKVLGTLARRSRLGCRVREEKLEAKAENGHHPSQGGLLLVACTYPSLRLAEGYAMWYLKVSQAPGLTERDKAGSYFRDKSISLGLFRRRRESRRERDREDHLGNPIDPAKSKSLRKLAGPRGEGGIKGKKKKKEKKKRKNSSSSAATLHYLDKSGIGGRTRGVLFPLPSTSRYRLLRSTSRKEGPSAVSPTRAALEMDVKEETWGLLLARLDLLPPTAYRYVPFGLKHEVFQQPGNLFLNCTAYLGGGYANAYTCAARQLGDSDRLKASPNAIPIPIPDTTSLACLDPMQHQFSSAFQGTLPQRGGGGPARERLMDNRTSETRPFSCSLSFSLLVFCHSLRISRHGPAHSESYSMPERKFAFQQRPCKGMSKFRFFWGSGPPLVLGQLAGVMYARWQVLAKEGSAVLLGFLSVWKPAGVRCDAMRRNGMGRQTKRQSSSIRSQCAASTRHLTAALCCTLLCCAILSLVRGPFVAGVAGVADVAGNSSQHFAILKRFDVSREEKQAALPWWRARGEEYQGECKKPLFFFFYSPFLRRSLSTSLIISLHFSLARSPVPPGLGLTLNLTNNARSFADYVKVKAEKAGTEGLKIGAGLQRETWTDESMRLAKVKPEPSRLVVGKHLLIVNDSFAETVNRTGTWETRRVPGKTRSAEGPALLALDWAFWRCGMRWDGRAKDDTSFGGLDGGESGRAIHLLADARLRGTAEMEQSCLRIARPILMSAVTERPNFEETEVQKRAVRIRVSPPIIVDMLVYPYVIPSVDMYQECLPSRSWVLLFCYPLGARCLLLSDSDSWSYLFWTMAAFATGSMELKAAPVGRDGQDFKSPGRQRVLNQVAFKYFRAEGATCGTPRMRRLVLDTSYTYPGGGQ
ncbi:hypothetical protein CCUS01_00489 [Colletotrichum cuscutae]|uniref:Uncharacterized protein n=1 Tax=Colletotrichum cuscutae TaxID=1209917 RepID=A0AAI9VE04_9PEZI|nr:hypothetical protein CCUS01_00489 [Colletotrichum cuscutae]